MKASDCMTEIQGLSMPGDIPEVSVLFASVVATGNVLIGRPDALHSL